MTLQGLLKHLPAICGRVLRGRLDLINFIARHRGNFLLASSKVNNSRFFRVRTAPSNFKEHSACDALGIKDFLYMFCVALDVLNLWPNGSCFYPTECSEYEISDPFIFPAYCHIYCKVVFVTCEPPTRACFFCFHSSAKKVKDTEEAMTPLLCCGPSIISTCLKRSFATSYSPYYCWQPKTYGR